MGNVFCSLSGCNSIGQVKSLYGIGENGSNFFNAFNGTFSSVTMTFTDGATVSDVGQFRLNAAPSVAAVPEPATWAMMMLGFAAIGFSVRRRKPVVRVRYRSEEQTSELQSLMRISYAVF